MKTSSTTAASGLKSDPLRRMSAIFVVAAVIGLGLSIELTHIHYATHIEENYQSVCAVSDEVNCETVARSPYSVFLGAPVSAWGMLGYTLIGVFAAWGVSQKRLHEKWPFGILNVLVLGAAAASLVLGYISFTKIDSVCLFCMSLYLLNTILTVLLVYTSVRHRIHPVFAFVQDLSAFFKRPVLLVATAVPFTGAALGLMFAVTPYWQRPGWNDLPDLKTGVDASGIHWIGAEFPLLTIVEFSDYQCPFCRHAHRDIRMTAGKFPKDVRLLHRHFPLDNACNPNIPRAFHAFACTFSRAAVCAGEQDKFWEMNDALFSIQDSISAANINVEHLSVELGLDRSQFLSCLNKKETPRAISVDIAEGERLQLAGTPTFFVNGQAFEGGISETVIENMLKGIREKRAGGEQQK